MSDPTISYGKLQVWERADYLVFVKTHALDFIDDEAMGLRQNGIDLERCISRPDGISISAFCDGIQYELQFDPKTPSTGHYSVSEGRFRGQGRVIEVREAKTPSFAHYFYIKVISQTTHHFVWRIAFSSFSRVVTEDDLQSE